MKVVVTEEDIKEGQRHSARYCPIARAIVRSKHVSPYDVSVGILDMRIDDSEYSLPLVARSFVANFDAGGTVKPFEFVARKQ